MQRLMNGVLGIRNRGWESWTFFDGLSSSDTTGVSVGVLTREFWVRQMDSVMAFLAVLTKHFCLDPYILRSISHSLSMSVNLIP